MFCCKKRKARKAAKAQAIVSSLAAVEVRAGRQDR